MDVTIPFNAIDFNEPFKMTFTGDELVDQLNLIEAITIYRAKFETKLFNKVTEQLRILRNA